jgi:ATP-dependent helicase/nuclease subunit A
LSADHLQKIASDPRQSAFVIASAGSGKTKTLIDRVARLLLTGAQPATILCITYTKTAAAEMQNRLYAHLGDWSVAANEDLADRLTALTGKYTPPTDDRALESARSLFARALETPGGLKIQTIHAFCEKVLRRFPMEAGLSPAFEILDEAAMTSVVSQAREACARYALSVQGPVAEAYDRLAIALDPGAFETFFGHLEAKRQDLFNCVSAAGGLQPLCLAVWEECGFPEGPAEPEAVEQDILAGLDREVFKRAAKRLGEGTKTDQKMSERLSTVVENRDLSFGVVAELLMTSSDYRKQFVGGAIWKSDPGLKEDLIAELEKFVLSYQHVQLAITARNSCDGLTLAQAYGAAYQTAKAQRNALDFSDLIDRTLNLLQNQSSAAWVLYKLDGGIDHILLDEAQDTAPSQWSILGELTQEFFSGASRVRNQGNIDRTLFVVGDRKQSIYSFQGAVPERLTGQIQTYMKQIEEGGLQSTKVDLMTSFRSAPPVLAIVDAAFGSEAQTTALQGTTASWSDHQPFRIGHPGCVDLWSLDIDSSAEDVIAWDPQETATEAKPKANRRLANRVAAEILRLVQGGERVHVGRQDWRPARYGDVLILTRTRGAMFEEILRALKHAGVPATGADRVRLSEHIVHADLLSLIRFALFPDDDLNLACLLKTPFIGWDDDRLYPLARHRQDRSLWQQLLSSAQADERTASTVAWLEQVLCHRSDMPENFCNWALQSRTMDGQSARLKFARRMGEEALEVLDALILHIEAAQARGVRTLEQMAADLSSLKLELKREFQADLNQVRVMTVHGAKGLEAPIVFLPDTIQHNSNAHREFVWTESGVPLLLFTPTADLTGSPRQALQDSVLAQHQESQRLLYVAMTRARDRLIIGGRVHETKRKVTDTSWYGVVEQAFALKAEDVTTCATDDGQPYQRFGDDPASLDDSPQRMEPGQPLPDWIDTPLAADVGALRFSSPSRLGLIRRDRAISPLANSGNLGRYRRGDLIHKLLEILPDIEPAQRHAQALRLLSREPGLSGAALNEIADAAMSILSAPGFEILFGPGSRPEVAIAGAAERLPKGMAIAGRVDRLVVLPDRVVAADYKTNRPAPQQIEDANPAYILQMAAYVEVLKDVFPGRTIEAVLVWTDGPKLMPVPENMMAHSLANLGLEG